MLPVIQNTDEVLLTLVPQRDHPDFALAPEPETRDALGDLIRRNETVTKVATEHVQHKGAAKKPKRYGAGDRQALDRLIQATGNGN